MEFRGSAVKRRFSKAKLGNWKFASYDMIARENSTFKFEPVNETRNITFHTHLSAKHDYICLFLEELIYHIFNFMPWIPNKPKRRTHVLLPSPAVPT